MKAYLVILKFLFISALFIVSNHNLTLSNSDDRQVFFDLYYSWADSTFENAKILTGFLVKSEWLPSKNSSLDHLGSDLANR